MAEDAGLESLFTVSPRRRVQHLLEMVERARNHHPRTARFVLAGVIATVDPETLTAVAEAMADALRKRAYKLVSQENEEMSP
jgi:hypothetical protein